MDDPSRLRCDLTCFHLSLADSFVFALEEVSVGSQTEASVEERGLEETGKVPVNPKRERAAEVMVQERQPQDPEDASSHQNCSYCWTHFEC